MLKYNKHSRIVDGVQIIGNCWGELKGALSNVLLIKKVKVRKLKTLLRDVFFIMIHSHETDWNHISFVCFLHRVGRTLMDAAMLEYVKNNTFLSHYDGVSPFCIFFYCFVYFLCVCLCAIVLFRAALSVFCLHKNYFKVTANI